MNIGLTYEREGWRRLCTVLLFLMPVVASLGSVIAVFGFAAARPLAAVLVIATMVAATRWNKVATWIVLLTVVWLTCGLLTLHSMDGMKRLLTIALSLASVLGFVLYPWTRERLTLLARAWLFAWVIAVLPAIYEIGTGNHLPNYLATSPAYVRAAAVDVASYFVNPNPFAYFLCSSMIIFVMGAGLESSRRLHLAMLAAFAISPVIIATTNSRLVLVVSLLVFVWMVATRLSIRPYLKWLVAIGVTFATLAAMALAASPTLIERITLSFQGSGSDRLSLYLNAIWMFLTTSGVGVGPGMFEHAMQQGTVPFPTQEAINPHSGVFEILSQYGALVSALVGAALLAVAWHCLRGLRQDTEDRALRLIRQGIAITALTLPLLSFGDSTFLDSPIAWTQIATMLGFYCAYRRIAAPQPRWRETPEAQIPTRLRVLRRAAATSSTR